jgi:CheY-like chemotaxis protein
MSRKKILIADDVEIFLMLEKTVFNRDEFELVTARSGRTILKLIKESEPDLVFMKLYMPEMNGDDCCRIVKEEEPGCNIPIIMVTEGDREEDLEKCRRSGCDAMLLKPFKRHDLMSVTTKFLHVKERADQRCKTRILVHYSFDSTNSFSGYSIDLNSGGLFLETTNPNTFDAPFNIEFKLPASWPTIQCKARPAWVNDPQNRKKPDLPAGIGIQFLDLPPTHMNAIQDYIKSMAHYC